MDNLPSNSPGKSSILTSKPSRPARKLMLLGALVIIAVLFYFFRSTLFPNQPKLVTQKEASSSAMTKDQILALQKKALDDYNQAKKTNDKQLIMQAEKEFEQILQIQPDNKGALDKVVFTKSWLLQRQEAIAMIQKRLQASPQDGDLYFYLGYLYDQSGNRDLAKQNYAKALEKNPKDPKIHLYLARQAEVDGNVAELKKHAQAVIDLGAQAGIYLVYGYNTLAQAYHLEGNDPKALENIHTALKINNDCEQCYQFQGEVLLEGKKGDKIVYKKDSLDKAIASLEKALTYNHAYALNYYYLGEAYALKGDKTKAAEYWQKALAVLATEPSYAEWYKPIIKKQLEDALANPGKFT